MPCKLIICCISSRFKLGSLEYHEIFGLESWKPIGMAFARTTSSDALSYRLGAPSSKVISYNESTKVEMDCPRKSRTISPQISSPSWGLALPMGTPSPSLAFGWYVLCWLSPKAPHTDSIHLMKQCTNTSSMRLP